jgi:hypothetical protein
LYAMSMVAIITVASAKVPSVGIRLSTTNISPWLESFVVQAAVDSQSVSSPLNLLYRWSSDTLCGNPPKVFSTVNVTSTAILSTTPGSPQLKFRPGILSPGASYCLRVSVNDTGYVGSIPGNSTVTFSVLRGPNSGYCTTTSARIGKEFETLFTFQCLK